MSLDGIILEYRQIKKIKFLPKLKWNIKILKYCIISANYIKLNKIKGKSMLFTYYDEYEN